MDGAAEPAAGSPDAILELLSSPEECSEEVLTSFAGVVRSENVPLDASRFLRATREGLPCFDVRSPGEFASGHIPGATSLPLFSDDDRAEVGKKFKRAGKQSALRLGMEKVRHRIPKLVAVASAALDRREKEGKPRKVLVHCWRGGMRSCAVAWLIRHQCGAEVLTLQGGYKAFRHWALGLYHPMGEDGKPLAAVERAAKRPRTEGDGDGEGEAAARGADGAARGPRVIIIGGRTGCGKTRVLHALRDQFGQQTVDLEGLARHRGSSFGWVGNATQPTTQQFGNDVADAWASLDPAAVVFVEDEGPNVGRVSTPLGLYHRMRHAPIVINLKVSMQHRVKLLLEDYASDAARAATEDWAPRMMKAVSNLARRLGKERMEHLREIFGREDYEQFAREMLRYYDRLYDKHIANAEGTGGGSGRRSGRVVDVSAPEDGDVLDAVAVARTVIALLRQEGERLK